MPGVQGMVVVITGASSGIGRATARALAEAGARLVLAARREETLEEAERECRNLGAEALVVPVDVSEAEDVAALAARAVERFGRIDVWFNNAGIGVFGKFEDIPLDAWRQVIETNLFGCVYGARAALDQFRRQDRGILINTASVVGRTGQPDSTAYVVSKYAVRGLSEALRQELLDHPGIHVCALLPSAIDTPFFQHAANYSGRRIRALPPTYPPEMVADTVLRLILRPRPEVIVGAAGKAMAFQQSIAPRLSTLVTGRLGHRGTMTDEPAPRSPGSLFEPMDRGTGAHGGWGTSHGRDGAGLGLLALGAVAIPLGILAWRHWAERSRDEAAERSRGAPVGMSRA
jgi:NAD(P)-dependent dehydrogenase (short-subunit alcohol dehydrogenase family)